MKDPKEGRTRRHQSSPVTLPSSDPVRHGFPGPGSTNRAAEVMGDSLGPLGGGGTKVKGVDNFLPPPTLVVILGKFESEN